jgi:hypothetical protein
LGKGKSGKESTVKIQVVGGCGNDSLATLLDADVGDLEASESSTAGQGGSEADAKRKKKPAQGEARRVGSGAAGVSGVQNRVKHEVCDDWRWTPMVCEGTWRFLGCARWLMMEW